MKTMIYLYSPEMQSGKSTCADYIVNTYKFEKLSFAEYVKKGAVTMLAPIIGLKMAKFHIYENKVSPIPILNNVTGRKILQTLGTDWGRNIIDEDIWVKTQITRILGSDEQLIVVDDFRFDNEVLYIKEKYSDLLNIKTIKIIRNDINNDDVYTQHESENGMSDKVTFDHVIINNGTINDLKEKINIIMGEIL